MNEQLEGLIERHAETLSAAFDVVETRKNWGPFIRIVQHRRPAAQKGTIIAA